MKNKRIDCPTCERMGRVTVILPDGRLTTTTCGDCNGEGWRYECNDPACRYCNATAAGALPMRPIFTWTNVDVYAS